MKKSNEHSERGATLLEVVVAIMIGLVIGVTGLYVLNAKVLSVEDVRVSKDAENAAEEALAGLSAVSADLAVGGSFTAINDNVLTLSSCTVETCDYVLEPDIEAARRTSFGKGFPYGTPVPTGYTAAFLRRWRVEDENPTYRLRKVTVAILKGESDTKPVLIAETTVHLSQ